jgi:hypothetical protein
MEASTTTVSYMYGLSFSSFKPLFQSFPQTGHPWIVVALFTLVDF